MSNEATITVTLTVEEARALLAAVLPSFGSPFYPPREPLEGARRKLREAEAATSAHTPTEGDNCE